MLDASLLPLRNKGAVLRAMRPTDAGAYAAGTADPAVRQYAHLPEPEYTEASVKALIEGTIREGMERGDLAVLTVADPADDAFAGSLVLFGVEEDSVEVGFWVHPDHRGKGVAAAALDLAVEFVRRSGFTRLTARTVPENEASRWVLERSGFGRGEETRGVAPSGQEVVAQHYALDLEPITLFPLETERLRLRLYQQADVHALWRTYSRPDVDRYLLEEPWSEEDAACRISERMVRTGLDSRNAALALIIEHEGAVVGDVAIWLTDVERRVAEIGWVMDPAHSGRGFATEAVRAVLRLAFEQYRVHRVVAQMDARNEASARLAQRAGMQREAHLRQDWWSKGEWTDTFVYGALSTDFPAGNP